jgi:hypothetical protein
VFGADAGEQKFAHQYERFVLRYRDYMAAKGVTVRRKKYVPAGEVRPLYSDAWVEDRRALIEAKNSDSRDAIRQAIGQLYDGCVFLRGRLFRVVSVMRRG